MRQITDINWKYIGDAVPAFVTVMFIPFGYSAAYGLIAGLMVYAALNGLIYLTRIISRNRIVPHDEDHREYWTSKYPGLSKIECTLMHALVKPHGKLPWFFTASQAVADQLRANRGTERSENRSFRSAWSYQDRLGSKASNQEPELETVVFQTLSPPTNPNREKVLRKI